ncbi:major type 1 subunit fimbrin (pilin) [Cupriavidus taiwanensis]|uniref:fimbrial protein n=1 Tax=Cupriavidus taiwanensis TaxID=164546 RepID=UPI000E1B2BA6|nr:fimbrial protein [Cupriavidus taiwanensis]SPA02311.1 major type 1 subunit fimbrin (pilin) [Cupriavidus taiwanensis]
MTNNKLLAALIVAGIAMGAQLAHATDGTITFNGKVVGQTCEINGNGSGSNDFTVQLPTVSTSTLNGAGKVAGQTPFNIALTNCTPGTTNVHTFFEAGPTTDATTGNLILEAGGAQNVQIRLLNGGTANTPIKAGFTDAAQNSNAVPVTNGAATLWYYAQYYATGAATAGLANSSVMYSISYE